MSGASTPIAPSSTPISQSSTAGLDRLDEITRDGGKFEFLILENKPKKKHKKHKNKQKKEKRERAAEDGILAKAKNMLWVPGTEASAALGSSKSTQAPVLSVPPQFPSDRISRASRPSSIASDTSWSSSGTTVRTESNVLQSNKSRGKIADNNDLRKAATPGSGRLGSAVPGVSEQDRPVRAAAPSANAASKGLGAHPSTTPAQQAAPGAPIDSHIRWEQRALGAFPDSPPPQHAPGAFPDSPPQTTPAKSAALAEDLASGAPSPDAQALPQPPAIPPVTSGAGSIPSGEPSFLQNSKKYGQSSGHYVSASWACAENARPAPARPPPVQSSDPSGVQASSKTPVQVSTLHSGPLDGVGLGSTRPYQASVVDEPDDDTAADHTGCLYPKLPYSMNFSDPRSLPQPPPIASQSNQSNTGSRGALSSPSVGSVNNKNGIQIGTETLGMSGVGKSIIGKGLSKNDSPADASTYPPSPITNALTPPRSQLNINPPLLAENPSDAQAPSRTLASNAQSHCYATSLVGRKAVIERTPAEKGSKAGSAAQQEGVTQPVSGHVSMKGAAANKNSRTNGVRNDTPGISESGSKYKAETTTLKAQRPWPKSGGHHDAFNGAPKSGSLAGGEGDRLPQVERQEKGENQPQVDSQQKGDYQRPRDSSRAASPRLRTDSWRQWLRPYPHLFPFIVIIFYGLLPYLILLGLSIFDPNILARVSSIGIHPDPLQAINKAHSSIRSLSQGLDAEYPESHHGLRIVVDGGAASVNRSFWGEVTEVKRAECDGFLLTHEAFYGHVDYAGLDEIWAWYSEAVEAKRCPELGEVVDASSQGARHPPRPVQWRAEGATNLSAVARELRNVSSIASTFGPLIERSLRTSRMHHDRITDILSNKVRLPGWGFKNTVLLLHPALLSPKTASDWIFRTAIYISLPAARWTLFPLILTSDQRHIATVLAHESLALRQSLNTLAHDLRTTVINLSASGETCTCSVVDLRHWLALVNPEAWLSGFVDDRIVSVCKWAKDANRGGWSAQWVHQVEAIVREMGMVGGEVEWARVWVGVQELGGLGRCAGAVEEARRVVEGLGELGTRWRRGIEA